VSDLIYFDGNPATPERAAEKLRAAGVPPAYVERALSSAAEFDAEGLKDWYTSGAGAEKIGWGTDGAWQRCVDIASEHMDPDQAKGFCQLRHIDATGKATGAKPKGD
jgi:hypothetical protein